MKHRLLSDRPVPVPNCKLKTAATTYTYFSFVICRESPPLNGPVEVNGPPPKKLQSTAFPIRRQKNVTIQWPVFIKKVGGPFKGGLSLSSKRQRRAPRATPVSCTCHIFVVYCLFLCLLCSAFVFVCVCFVP